MRPGQSARRHDRDRRKTAAEGVLDCLGSAQHRGPDFTAWHTWLNELLRLDQVISAPRTVSVTTRSGTDASCCGVRILKSVWRREHRPVLTGMHLVIRCDQVGAYNAACGDGGRRKLKLAGRRFRRAGALGGHAV